MATRQGRRAITATHSAPSARQRFTPSRLILALAAFVVLLYGGAILWLVTQETRLVFQAGRPLPENRPSFPYEQIDRS